MEECDCNSTSQNPDEHDKTCPVWLNNKLKHIEDTVANIQQASDEIVENFKTIQKVLTDKKDES